MPDPSKEQSAKELELVNKARPLIADAYTHATRRFKERKIYNDLYYVHDESYAKYKKDHQAKFISPQYQSFAEQKISLYAQGITGTDVQPFFLFTPNNNLYASRTAQALTKMVYSDLMADHYYETNYKTAHHYVVDGFAIEKPWWNLQTVKFYPAEQEQITVDDFGNFTVQMMQPEPIDRTIIDRPCVKSIAPNNLWLDPSARNEDELRYAVERVILPFSRLKALEAQGFLMNVDMLKTIPFPTRGDMSDFLASVSHERRDYVEFYEAQVGNKAIDKDDPLCEMLVMWFRGFFYCIGNNQVLLSYPKSFPWLKDAFPFVFYSNYPSNYKFDGLSDFYFNKYLIKETNKVGNMLIDNIYRHLNPTNFVNGLLPADDIAAIKSGEGNIVVQAATADLITQFRPDLPSGSVVNFLDALVATSKDSMGLAEITSGSSPGSEFRTTGSMQLVTQLSNLRSAVKLQLLANRKRDVGTKLLNIYRHFMTEDRAVAVSGALAPELIAIKNEDLQLDYNIDINIAPAADILRSQEIQAMRALFSDMVQLPGFRANRAALEICAKSGLYEDAVGLFDSDILQIEQRNAMDAKSMDMAPNPAFAGMNAIPSPDAGGSPQTNAANQQNAAVPA